MSFENLFSGVNFATTIQRYCDAIGWKVADLNNQRAMLRFNMDSGREQTLFILRYESTVEFSVPSVAAFDSDQNIPHVLSTLLLQRNAERKVGFWCIEKISGKYVYSCMHNAELQLLNEAYFAAVVRALVMECDDFEGTLSRILS